MKYDLMEEALTAGKLACVLPIIRRNLRKASIIGLLHRSGTPEGLESVKKTPQVAPVGTGPIQVGCCRLGL
jgi:hypothetical protein